MSRSTFSLAFAAFGVLVLALGAWRHSARPLLAPAAFVSVAAQAMPAMALREVARYDIPMPANTPAAHASFLLADKSGGQDRLRAFWFAGSRESGPDVQIVASEFLNGTWTPPSVVVNRHTVFAELGLGSWIRRLGNPVAWTDRQGRTHLYVVATGLGGWAASRVLHLRQDKPVRTEPVAVLPFKPIGFLSLSPLFNLSHLVRGVPVPMQDGGVLLPVYFEIGLKYPAAVRLDQDGDLVPSRDAVVGMAGNLKSLQPTVVVASESNATAYLRDNSDQKKLRFVQTADGGKNWHDVPSSQGAVGDTGADFVINPDSSALALRFADQTLLIHNPQTSGRHRLVIEGSKDGLRGFRSLATLEYEPEQLEGVKFNEYSYPSAVVIGKQLHVSYTYQKHFIRHVVLNIDVTNVKKEAAK